MSIAEPPVFEPGFERTPPNNIEAEQSVLGGMLLSKDAIADVVEVIRSDDFYRPAHQIIYDIITDLYGRGDPADAVTIFDELQKRGEVARIGGGAYLHTLTAVVPTAANAGYYARIVREQAILRRLIEAGTRIVSYGYGGQDEEVDDLVDRAQAEIYKVTERRTSEDYIPLADIMPGALDELEAIGGRGGQMVGVPTGFQDLDALTNGLHPGQMIVVAARPAIGKALALDTPLPTPNGWTTMGQVQVGDYLIGADGKPTRVVAATGIMHGRPCYEVEFNDGTVIVADAHHQWVTWDSATRKRYDYACPDGPAYPLNWVSWSSRPSSTNPYRPGERDLMRKLRAEGLTAAQVGQRLGRTADAIQQQWNKADPPDKSVKPRTTAELAESLRSGKSWNHGIPAAFPLDMPDVELPIDPYVLGYLLGDGDTRGGRVACDPRDKDWLIQEFNAAGYATTKYDSPGHFYARGLRTLWRDLDLADGKHIPALYLRASYKQRLALAQGLIDSDGYVDDHGSFRFTNTNRALIDGFRELVATLGCVPKISERQRVRKERPCLPSWDVIVPTPEPLARMPRKAEAARQAWGREQATRYITDVRPVPSVPVRCVEVDNADHMYLAGRTWIPTHNSTLGLDFARSAAIKHGMTTVVFSLEMSRNEITMRLLSAEARVALHSMRSGTMTDDDWAKLARRMGEVAEAPLFIDDSPNMSMMEIRAKCRRLKQRNDLRFVIIDYLQLMSSPKKTESRQNEVSEISRAIKLLAKELEVPVIAISQLNRGPEQRTDKRPMVSDLRESGCLTADTRILRADTGAETSLGELLERGERDIPVWSLDERLRLIPRTMTHVFPSGVKEVFRLRLRSGREITATANHPFMTYDGWCPLGDLPPGARLAVPRHVPAPELLQEWSQDDVVLLAHMVGDGSGDPTCARPGSPGLSGQGGRRGHVPAGVFSLPRSRLALFLRHLWAAGGSVRWDEENGRARIDYTSTSRRLVDDVARLLLRFNVMTGVAETREDGHPPGHRLYVHGPENQLRFLDDIFLGDIGVHGPRSTEAERCATALRAVTAQEALDAVPHQVWDRVGSVLAEEGPAHHGPPSESGIRRGAGTPGRRAPGRERLGRVAVILDDARLEMIATNDVFWDEVVSVESQGEQAVFDATVPGTHNFVANGIGVHNSIEQDADMVILLHREDAYERESPRAGEADLIVAKHRNGPTATVTVAFQGHYSRFVDMAPH